MVVIIGQAYVISQCSLRVIVFGYGCFVRLICSGSSERNDHILVNYCFLWTDSYACCVTVVNMLW